MRPHPSEDRDGWASALACAFLADDLSIAGIARYGRVHAADAAAVLDAARAAGIVDDDGIDTARAWLLVAELDAETVAEVHLAAARHLFAAGTDRIPDAIVHARAAGNRMPLDELVAMADHGGRLCLSLGDHDNARDLLRLALEFDVSDELRRRAERLLLLAEAETLAGDTDAARDHLAQAVVVGEMLADPAVVVRAAVAGVLPIDWHDGDPRTSALLRRAEAMDLSDDDRVAVTAARAIVESRIPLLPDRSMQLAWITRPEVAQDLADEALAKSGGARPDVRLLALLAWRSTHRAPRFLADRRAVSSEALDLAQRLRAFHLQHEAAVWLAVDALESGDRPAFDRSLGVARWLAESTGSPLLAWRSLTLAAGAAHLDGDLEAAAALVEQAHEAGVAADHPGRLAADLTFFGQMFFSRDTVEEMPVDAMSVDHPALVNPLFRAGIAYLCAVRGDPAGARRHAHIAFRQLDAESSYLNLCTRLAGVAVLIRDDDLARRLIDVLTPWAEHVSVDAAGWWCDGPVAFSLARLHHQLGDDTIAARLLDRSQELAVGLNDVRSLAGIEPLRAALSPVRVPEAVVSLTPRESEILALMATGRTNREIAELLAFSPSTVRVDSMSIYRKLGVDGRVEAVTVALARGLVPAPEGRTDER